MQDVMTMAKIRRISMFVSTPLLLLLLLCIGNVSSTTLSGIIRSVEHSPSSGGGSSSSSSSSKERRSSAPWLLSYRGGGSDGGDDGSDNGEEALVKSDGDVSSDDDVPALADEQEQETTGDNDDDDEEERQQQPPDKKDHDGITGDEPAVLSDSDTAASNRTVDAVLPPSESCATPALQKKRRRKKSTATVDGDDGNVGNGTRTRRRRRSRHQEGGNNLPTEPRPPPPNALFRWLLTKGIVGHTLITLVVVTLELLEKYVPHVGRAARYLLVRTRPASLPPPARLDRPPPAAAAHGHYAAFVDGSKGTQKARRARRTQTDAASLRTFRRLGDAVDMEEVKLRYCSPSFVARHGLGRFRSRSSTSRSDGSAEDPPPVDTAEDGGASDASSPTSSSTTRKPTTTATADPDDDDTEWVLQALRTDNDRLDTDTLSSLRDSSPRTRHTSPTSSPDNNNKKKKNTLLTSLQNTITSGSTRILGAYPNDAVPTEDAGDADGVLVLAARYGYGAWDNERAPKKRDGPFFRFDVSLAGQPSSTPRSSRHGASSRRSTSTNTRTRTRTRTSGDNGARGTDRPDRTATGETILRRTTTPTDTTRRIRRVVRTKTAHKSTPSPRRPRHDPSPLGRSFEGRLPRSDHDSSKTTTTTAARRSLPRPGPFSPLQNRTTATRRNNTQEENTE